ncbi:hypothetical protein Celal_0232 [Cellulophaga algicola DSM 14237]|uniref:Uncharacterized protein n=1 Tax=Cellulophaga algicola (strain DSM 14237 / IC166 / ACAM 630) TaxID=688270 RepID=E6X8J5_CELAD|nr:hypothetical protein [Cellulophaga algicola]ADV47582.1 hypothetical protein Celal_0232 [Cellulophaga algicola DSM 14237]
MNSKYLAQYLENGIWKTISCYTYKKLCNQEPTKWEHLDLKSKPIQGKRYNVHTRSSSSKFCFSGSGPTNVSKNRMTTTHEFITEVISELDTLNLKINNYSLKIIPDTIIHEKEIIKVYCTEKKEVVEYIPDLLIRFSNPKTLEKRWGGQIAIEVNVTHSPDDTKRKHFQFLGIPLLEIDATKDLKFKLEGKEVQEKELDIYKKELELALSTEIEASIKYPTFSNRSLGNQVYKLKQEKKELEQNHNDKIQKISKLARDYKNLDTDFKNSKINLTKTIRQKESQLLNIEKKLAEYKNRSFIQKLADLLSSKK